MASKTPRGRAAKAAAQLLQERVRYIEDLEAACADERAAQDAIEAAQESARKAAEASRAAYSAAHNAGWTDAELTQLGYGDARPSRGRRPGKRPATSTSSDSTAEPAETDSSDAPAPAAGTTTVDDQQPGGTS